MNNPWKCGHHPAVEKLIAYAENTGVYENNPDIEDDIVFQLQHQQLAGEKG